MRFFYILLKGGRKTIMTAQANGFHRTSFSTERMTGKMYDYK